ncbi:uncharacterized protein METZ01_LOCUS236127, partial [marine metagenome]
IGGHGGIRTLDLLLRRQPPFLARPRAH